MSVSVPVSSPSSAVMRAESLQQIDVTTSAVHGQIHGTEHCTVKETRAYKTDDPRQKCNDM